MQSLCPPPPSRPAVAGNADEPESCAAIDDAFALFLSLPVAAQASIRTLAHQSDSLNLRGKLARALCPYVQTLADAQNIAELLAAESTFAIENELVERERRIPSPSR